MPDRVALSDQDREQLGKLLSAPIFFPKELKDWLADYWATNVPLIPYTHFLGAKLNLAKSGDYIATTESTSSSTFTNLATVGPTVDNLADGKYLIAFGAFLNGQGALVSRSINGAAADDDHALWENENKTSGGRMEVQTLKNDNQNSVQLKYRKDGGADPSFNRRWLVVIRISSG